MVDLNNAKATDVGEQTPTDASQKAIDSIVDDVVTDVGVQENASKTVKREVAQKDKELDEEVIPEEVTEDAVEETEEVEEKEKEKVEDDDEDLIPRSKVQDRFDKLTDRIKSLELENSKLTQKAPQTKEEKLDRLSLEELKGLRRETRIAQKSEDDRARLDELFKLEEDVEERMTNFPQRFQQKQNQNLIKVLPEFAKIDPNVMNQKGNLWSIAESIYQRSSALRSSEMGQVEAMLLAAEHFNLKNSNKTGLEEKSTLSRQVNNLKRKTSLEGKTRVQKDQGVDFKKLRQKAVQGNLVDKENFVRDALIPDNFLEI